MRTIITTTHRDFKVNVGKLVADSDSYCHYTFRVGGGLPCARGLENKVFSRAAAAGLGEFTPNIG
jgi:hypothetical protein